MYFVSCEMKQKKIVLCLCKNVITSSQKSINRTTCSSGSWEGEDWSKIKRSKTCFCLETRHWYKPSKSLQIQKHSAILSSSIPGYEPQVLWWWTADRKVLQYSYWINSLTSKTVRLRDPRAPLRQEEPTVKYPQLVWKEVKGYLTKWFQGNRT